MCSLFRSAARPGSYRGRVLRPRQAVFDEAGQACAPRGSGHRRMRRLRTWGSQIDLSGGLETAAAHSQSSSDSSDVLTPRAEAHPVASSAREEDPMFEQSDSEELDMLGTEAGEIAESSPLHSPACEERVDVLSCAVDKIYINWPQEKLEVQVKSRLDERFLLHRSQPQCRGSKCTLHNCLTLLCLIIVTFLPLQD